MTSSCCNFVPIYLDFLILICRGELQLTVEYLHGVFHVGIGCGVCEVGGEWRREGLNLFGGHGMTGVIIPAQMHQISS